VSGKSVQRRHSRGRRACLYKLRYTERSGIASFTCLFAINIVESLVGEDTEGEEEESPWEKSLADLGLEDEGETADKVNKKPG
jgi:hypothetical protein